jgi:predicted lipid-binding transport protein (Tim44 family)
MTSSHGFRLGRTALSVGLVLALAIGGSAEARRGGSFGSRGSRTYYTPGATSTYSGYTAPVQRSMTTPGATPTYGAPQAQPYNTGTYSPYNQAYNAYPQRGGFFHSFGGGLMSGMLAGGLIGAMSGHGWGGYGGYGGGNGGYGAGASMFGLLIQLGVLALIGWFLLRLFRRRSGPLNSGFQNALYEGPSPEPMYGYGHTGVPLSEPGPMTPNVIPMPGPGYGAPPSGPGDEIGLTQGDRNDFERLLGEVQTAFGHEDYAGLRERCTPEIVSFLSEELSENATHGRKNDVTGTRLLQSDVSEAWREGPADYATVAMRYESIDLMRDRQSGAVIEGDPDKPSETTELWTFVRQGGGPWKLSAIQDPKAV